MIKVLNLYAGIGGNRKLWENVDVTAVELDAEIAKTYQELYPNDRVVVDDAHKYLIENFREFEFIWSSPPCPSHSCMRRARYTKATMEARAELIYPDMKLYEEIIFLQEYFPRERRFCVENVIAFYKPLIRPKKIQRHWFWANFPLNEKKFESDKLESSSLEDLSNRIDIDLSKSSLSKPKQELVFRNCVNSELGKYIFDMAFKTKQEVLI